jgi:hypothetical protein
MQFEQMLAFAEATTLLYLRSAHMRRRCDLLLRWQASVWTGLWHEDVRLACFLTRNVRLFLHDKTGVIA